MTFSSVRIENVFDFSISVSCRLVSHFALLR